MIARSSQSRRGGPGTGMRVRPYIEADLDALKRMHAAQGFDYPFPDLAGPIFLSKLVMEDGAGKPVMASLVRLTSEVYLLMEPREATPYDRLRGLLTLHRVAEQDAYDRGLEDCHAFLPPQVVRSFGRRLERLGWVREPWTPYCKRLRGH